jgi:hypothetical protein
MRAESGHQVRVTGRVFGTRLRSRLNVPEADVSFTEQPVSETGGGP